MPTIFSHTAIPIAIALGTRRISPRLLCAGMAASIIPDLDTVGFRFGVAYAHEFGHRGFTHSLVFALLLAIFAALFAPELRMKRMAAVIFISSRPHPMVCWICLPTAAWASRYLGPLPIRVFFPLRMINVSPIGLRGFLGPAGFRALKSELLWIWVPAITLGLAVYFRRRH